MPRDGRARPHPEDQRPPSAKRAGAVTLVGQLTKMTVQFAAIIAFSHLLSPRDIGLIAMLTVFISLGDIIRDCGLSQAAVQTPELAHGQASNLFWTNTLIGLVMTSGLSLAAPGVALLYSEPALRDIAPWVALCLTLNALQTQFQVRLIRDLRFTALSVTDISSQIIGLTGGLAAALAGAGYWALVIQMQCICGSLLVQRALIAGWWPGRPRREPGMAALYRFGMHSGLAQLLSYFASNTDSYIIGIRWGASALGIYSRAYQMYTVPVNSFISPLTNVALPHLSKQRHAGSDFYPLLWKAQVAISALITFLFVLTGSLAVLIVRLALGPAWASSAPLLSILSIAGAVQVLNYPTVWAFLASANAKQLLFNGLVTKSLLVASIAVGSLGGLEGVAWGFAGGTAMSWFISLAWLKRCDAMPISQFLRSGIHTLMCGLLSGGIVWILIDYYYTRVPIFILIVVGFAAATSLYVPLLMSNAAVREFLVDTARPILAKLKVLLRSKMRRI